MEARFASVILLALCYFSLGAGHFSRTGYVTENFVIRCQDQKLAKVVGDKAEIYRSKLAKQWLGHELGPWHDRCPIVVEIRPHAEGRTSFSFQTDRSGKSYPLAWDMWIAGPTDRLLDAVLPHEITHTIFATHFGRPLPRWADEGACTTVEHISERQKNHKMLIEFLTTRRGIPFNQMFRMKEYPRDILPLYAQGYSVARYFIEQKGRRHFIQYLGESMDTEDWDRTTRKYYGHDDLSDLQVSWVNWIKAGCPKPQGEQQVASSDSPDSQELVRVRQASATISIPKAVSAKELDSDLNPTYVATSQPRNDTKQGGSWYAQQMRRNAAANTQNRFRKSRSNNIPDSTPEGVIVSGGDSRIFK